MNCEQRRQNGQDPMLGQLAQAAAFLTKTATAAASGLTVVGDLGGTTDEPTA